MEAPLVSKDTTSQTERFLASPAHGLVITGSMHTNKLLLAEYIVSKLLGVNNISTHPHVLMIEPAPSSIGIDTVREIQQFIKLAVPGTASYRRAIIISRAETITTEAQNALLKFLEEPPADTLCILCTSNPNKLLPTIVSRLQSIQSTPLSFNEATTLYDANYSQSDIERAYFMSEGAPQLLQTLLTDPNSESLQTLQEAKQLLSKNSFEKMLQVEYLSKDKEALNMLLRALLRVINAAMVHAAKQQNDQKVSLWLGKQKLVLRGLHQLEQGTNAKLVATSVMLAL